MRPRLAPEHRVLCLSARTEVDYEAEEELLERLAGPLDWERLWEQGHLHEVLPLVGRSLAELPPAAGVPDAWLERAERRRVATGLRAGMLADELVSVLTAFGTAGIEAMPVKGAVLGEVVYGDASLRPAIDLDILVRAGDLAAARATLSTLDFQQAPEPTFAAATHTFHDPGYLREVDGETVRIELHRELWAAEQFRPHGEFFQRSSEAMLRDLPVRVLSPEDMLVHQAVHRTRSPLRLRFLCDVAEVLRRYGETLDWDLVVQLATTVRARTALSVAVSLACEHLGAPLPLPVGRVLWPAGAKRLLLERTCGASAMFRPAPPDDIDQQPHLLLRTFEQDGASHIASNLVHALWRKRRRHAYERRACLRGAPSPSSEASAVSSR